MKLVRSCAVFFLTIFLSFISLKAFSENAAVGSTAPAFSLNNALGKPVSLSQFSGKIVIIEWFNQNCPFVRKFYQNGDMRVFQKQARDKGAVWLTINSSAQGKQGYIAPEEAQTIANEHDLDPNFLLLDPEGTVGKLYGAKVTPHMFVVDSKGNLAYAGAVDSQPTTKASDIAGSANYVMQALEALTQGRAPSVANTDPYGCGVKYK